MFAFFVSCSFSFNADDFFTSSSVAVTSLDFSGGPHPVSAMYVSFREVRCTEGRRRGAGKRDSQNGGKREKTGKIMQHCAIFFNRKNAKDREPKNTGRVPRLQCTGKLEVPTPLSPPHTDCSCNDCPRDLCNECYPLDFTFKNCYFLPLPSSLSSMTLSSASVSLELFVGVSEKRNSVLFICLTPSPRPFSRPLLSSSLEHTFPFNTIIHSPFFWLALGRSIFSSSLFLLSSHFISTSISIIVTFSFSTSSCWSFGPLSLFISDNEYYVITRSFLHVLSALCIDATDDFRCQVPFVSNLL